MYLRYTCTIVIKTVDIEMQISYIVFVNYAIIHVSGHLLVGEPLPMDAWSWYNRVVGDRKCIVVDTYWQTGKFCIGRCRYIAYLILFVL